MINVKNDQSLRLDDRARVDSTVKNQSNLVVQIVTRYFSMTGLQYLRLTGTSGLIGTSGEYS